MGTKKSVEMLQLFITNLNAQSFSHKLQSKIFGSLRLTKLEEKYATHAQEESQNIDTFICRLLDIGGEVKQEAVAETMKFRSPALNIFVTAWKR